MYLYLISNHSGYLFNFHGETETAAILKFSKEGDSRVMDPLHSSKLKQQPLDRLVTCMVVYSPGAAVAWLPVLR